MPARELEGVVRHVHRSHMDKLSVMLARMTMPIIEAVARRQLATAAEVFDLTCGNFRARGEKEERYFYGLVETLSDADKLELARMSNGEDDRGRVRLTLPRNAKRYSKALDLYEANETRNARLRKELEARREAKAAAAAGVR